MPPPYLLVKEAANSKKVVARVARVVSSTLPEPLCLDLFEIDAVCSLKSDSRARRYAVLLV